MKTAQSANGLLGRRGQLVEQKVATLVFNIGFDRDLALREIYALASQAKVDLAFRKRIVPAGVSGTRTAK